MCCFYEAKTLKLDNRYVRQEPDELPDRARIWSEFANAACPVCDGLGRLKCHTCQEGRVALLGGYQQCGRCHGEGIKLCPICDGHGKIGNRRVKSVNRCS